MSFGYNPNTYKDLGLQSPFHALTRLDPQKIGPFILSAGYSINGEGPFYVQNYDQNTGNYIFKRICSNVSIPSHLIGSDYHFEQVSQSVLGGSKKMRLKKRTTHLYKKKRTKRLSKRKRTKTFSKK